MIDKTILLSLSDETRFPTKIFPSDYQIDVEKYPYAVNFSPSYRATQLFRLYRAATESKLLSLAVDFSLPSYPLVPWPSELDVENTEDLNKAIVAKDEFKNTQIFLHLFAKTSSGSWVFLRTFPLVNRGVPLSLDMLGYYKVDLFGCLPLPKGFELGILCEFFLGLPGETDWINLRGNAEELLLPSEEQDNSLPVVVEILRSIRGPDGRVF